jgi:DNA-binding NarL/FixJ family response regulator
MIHEDRLRCLRLVLLDNDPAVLDLLSLDLGLEGHEILASVTERAAACQACVDLHPDVLVVDLRLGPGADGIEVARSVAGPGLRIVLYTNYVNAAVVDRATRVGITVVEKGNLGALRRAVAG